MAWKSRGHEGERSALMFNDRPRNDIQGFRSGFSSLGSCVEGNTHYTEHVPALLHHALPGHNRPSVRTGLIS